MASTFHGIEVTKSGLYAQQAAMNTAGHNIANANTPGYSRQRVNLQTTMPLEMPGMQRGLYAGQLGTGVTATDIQRLRDSFLDGQFREENTELGEWETRSTTLDKLEALFNEPSDSGLRTVLEQFWASWQDLSRDPQGTTGMSARTVVVERGIAVAEAFNHTAKQLENLQKDTDVSLQAKVNEANSYLNQIASLNQQITRVEAVGQSANDLSDQRDLLVDKLSKLMNLDVTNANGGYSVKVGTVELVNSDGSTVNQLAKSGDASSGYVIEVQDSAAATVATIYNASTNTLASGELRGILESALTVKSYQDGLDDMVRRLVNDENGINALHQGGFDLDGNPGLQLFTSISGAPGGDPVSAADIQFNPTIAADGRKLAAAANNSGFEGDGENALRIAQLQHTPMDLDGNLATDDAVTLDAHFGSMMAQLGVESQEAKRYRVNQQVLVDQMDILRQSVMGVSLDEEMANLVKFQNSYNAAARALTTMDEALERLINGTGLVGR